MIKKSHKAFLMSALILSLSACSLPWDRSSSQKSPQTSQYCFSAFQQSAVLQINTASPVNQTASIKTACLSGSTTKFGKTITIPNVNATSISIQPIQGNIITEITQPDSVVLNNCTGNAPIQQIFELKKSLQFGISVAGQYYSKSPDPANSSFDQIAKALYTAFSSSINEVLPTTLITAPLTANPHSKATQNIQWDETFQAGIVNVLESGGTVIGNLTFELPTTISVDKQALDKNQPQSASC